MMDSCWCDYDPPEFWSANQRKAKVPHRCDECRAVIQPGEMYEYVSGKWGGYLGCFHTCSRCVGLRRWVTNNLPCFCWAHGNLHDDAREAVDAAYIRAPDEVRGLRFGLGRRLVEISRGT